MHKSLLAIAIISAILLLSAGGCTSGKNGLDAERKLNIVRVSDNTVLSVGTVAGAVTMHVGDDLPIRIVRKTDTEPVLGSDDVTSLCTFVFDVGGIATISATGVIHAVAVGTAQLDVKHEISIVQPIEHSFLNITVTP